MKARIVIGASFGDEGKGLITDYLCSKGAGMVVRFNGGAQAGHTVVTPDGERHVFRHFGSGTLLEVPTFFSKYCILNPILFHEERRQLIELGYHPTVYADPECLVTTFADMIINQTIETRRGKTRHGSCGVGFYETIQRSALDHLKITMGDIWNGSRRLEQQLEEICTKYAEFRLGEPVLFSHETVWRDMIKAFIAGCEDFANCIHPLAIGQCVDPVFEGAQGLLLDKDNEEFFPHLTPSNTGMKNVRSLCAEMGIGDYDQEIYYVSRTYLTRHGAGPLPGEDPSMSFEDRTNNPTTFQGSIRFAPMDYDKLTKRCAADAGAREWRLALTHCDQLAAGLEADLYSTGETRNDVNLG